MARHMPHRSHMGVGHSAAHPHDRHGDEDISSEQGAMSHGSGPGGAIDMRPQPHEVRGTVGGVGRIAGPTLTGENIGPINAPIYESETAEGNSGEL